MIAAQFILDACKEGRVGREERYQFIAHQHGRPSQVVQLKSNDRARTPAELLNEARRMAGIKVVSKDPPATESESP